MLDTAEDWQWWTDTWQYVLDVAELKAGDRGLFSFSYGPFIGFWSAHDAAVARGLLAIPGGGLNTLARLELAQVCRVTAIFCTPSYALHMVEVASENQIDPTALAVQKVIVAGEPGGSLPSVRERIESAWDAPVVIVRCAPKPPLPSPGYQATRSSPWEADSRSRIPSPSTSAAKSP